MRVQMLGLCRYSYVGLRGYQVEHHSYEERRAFLYQPDRLARRWLWLTEVALPAWLAQTDADFTLVLMTGPDLPEPYLSGLRDLVNEIPQLRLSLIPPMERHLAACRMAIAPHVEADADVIGHFRHDDDDAVAVDYIARTRGDFMDVRQIWQPEGRLSLDYSRGAMLTLSPQGAQLRPRICTNMGVALTIFLAPSFDETALHYNHTQLPRWMPGVAITRPFMFLRGTHQDSDSGDAGPGLPWDLPADAVDRVLWDRFRLAPDALKQLGARLSGIC